MGEVVVRVEGVDEGGVVGEGCGDDGGDGWDGGGGCEGLD